MILKANISARTADVSEWQSVQIQKEVIKTEHTQNSLWYLNSCWWNPVQELRRVTIIIPQAFHNTRHQHSYQEEHPTAASPLCFPLPLLSPCLENNPFHGKRGRAKIVTQCHSCFREKMKTVTRYYGQLLVWGQLSGSGGLNISVPPGIISFPCEFGPMRSGRAGSGSLAFAKSI